MSAAALNLIQPYAAPAMGDVLREIDVQEQYAREFDHIGLPFSLKPHQYNSLKAAIYWPKMGLFDEARCGKSVVMHLAAIYFSHFGYNSVFLMPPSLFTQFEEEFNRIENHGRSIEVFTHSPAKRTRLLKEWSDSEGKTAPNLLVMSKEVFKKHVSELLYARYKALFFDECHMGLQSWKLLTPKKQITTYGAVKKFMENLPQGRLILSTGTPVSNELETAWGIISLRSPQLYESKAHFDQQHVSWKQIKVRRKKPRFGGEFQTIHVVDHANYRDLPRLHRSIYDQSVRAIKLNVLDIKKPNFQEVPIKLSASHYEEYKKLVRTRMAEVNGELVDARSASKLRQLCMQSILSPELITSKNIHNSVMELIDDLLGSIRVSENKVVMFANFNLSIEALARRFKHLNPATVYGPNGSDKNRANIQRFKTNKECRVMIANPVSGGVGLTLGTVSQNMIVVEPVSTPGQFDQVVSRVILSGQTKPAVVYIVSVLGTAFPKLIELMKGKAIRNEEVLQDRQSLIDELLGKG